jgi:hypothetical protein
MNPGVFVLLSCAAHEEPCPDGFLHDNDGNCIEVDADADTDTDSDTDTDTSDVDHDGDGFSESEGDCDDTNADAYPNAIDVVGDGVDQNCDDVDGVDEDGDGYASVESGGDDCDDTAPAFHPGAEETWYDGYDQDCDGASDNDADGDGYDSDEYGGTDCDDTTASINPGLLEEGALCLNGIDDDCNSRPTYCSMEVAAVELLAANDDDRAGSAVAAGDLNADGISDALIGAQWNDSVVDLSGAVYVAMGPVTTTTWLGDVPGRLIGEAEEHVGDYLVSGDLDADGYDDVVTSGFLSHGGITYFAYGPVTAEIDLGAEASIAPADSTYEEFGTSIALADLAGTGAYDHVLIGKLYDDEAAEDAGAVYVIDAPVTGAHDTSDYPNRLLGEHAGDQVATVAAGDMDGDGVDEIVVGTEYSPNDPGAAYVVSGPVTGAMSLSSANSKWLGEAGALEYAGGCVYAADIDGDGLDDLLVAAPYDDLGGSWGAGAVYVIPSPPSGTSDLASAPIVVVGDELDNLGLDIAAADLDGDEDNELLIGSLNAGVYLIAGPLSGTVSLPAGADQLVAEGHKGGRIGTAIATGDFDGDGTPQILLGDEFYGWADSGKAYIF